MITFASLLKGGSAGVVKLVDTLDLGSSAARLGGSSPSARTAEDSNLLLSFLCPGNTGISMDIKKAPSMKALFFYDSHLKQISAQQRNG